MGDRRLVSAHLRLARYQGDRNSKTELKIICCDGHVALIVFKPGTGIVFVSVVTELT